MSTSVRGLFITGTDTGVGKTYVAAHDRPVALRRRAGGSASTSRRPAAAAATARGRTDFRRRRGAMGGGRAGRANWSMSARNASRPRWPRTWPPRGEGKAARSRPAPQRPGLLAAAVRHRAGRGRRRADVAAGRRPNMWRPGRRVRLSAGGRRPNMLGTINATLQTLVAAAAFGQGLAGGGHRLEPSRRRRRRTTSAWRSTGGSCWPAACRRCWRKSPAAPSNSTPRSTGLRWRKSRADAGLQKRITRRRGDAEKQEKEKDSGGYGSSRPFTSRVMPSYLRDSTRLRALILARFFTLLPSAAATRGASGSVADGGEGRDPQPRGAHRDQRHRLDRLRRTDRAGLQARSPARGRPASSRGSSGP